MNSSPIVSPSKYNWRLGMPSKKRNQNQNGWIEVRGARTHNLKDVDVSIPRGKFVVLSGVSGTG